MASQVTFNELLERNKAYASKHTPLPYFPELPSVGLAPPAVLIVTCADPRCVPETFLDLKPLETVVLRTAGGRPQLVIDDIIFLDGALSFKSIVVIHHTDCGKSFMTDDEARGILKQRFPGTEGADSMEFNTFKTIGVEQSIKDDINFLKQAKFVRKELVESVSGFVFDVKTGKLRPVEV